MGKKFDKRDGGVSDHAIKRVIHQYKSSLGKKEIRRIVREEKRRSGNDKNGFFIISSEAQRKLRLVFNSAKKILVGIVINGTVVTVEDKFV